MNELEHLRDLLNDLKHKVSADKLELLAHRIGLALEEAERMIVSDEGSARRRDH